MKLRSLSFPRRKNEFIYWYRFRHKLFSNSLLDKTGRPQIIPNKEGDNITPSVVEVREDGEIEVGKYAYLTWGYDKENAHARFKRQMHEDVEITLGSKNFSPAQLSAEVLKKLIDDTKDVVGEIEEVVISIPANFPNDARVSTLEAGQLAGLKVNFIVNEPTAAALGYAFLNQEKIDGIFAVYDFGGGTLISQLLKLQEMSSMYLLQRVFKSVVEMI